MQNRHHQGTAGPVMLGPAFQTRRSLKNCMTNLGIFQTQTYLHLIGQVKILNNVGGIWLADGAELLLLSALIRAVSLEWDLNVSHEKTVSV